MKLLKNKRYDELLKKEKRFDNKVKEMEESQKNLQLFFRDELSRAEQSWRSSEHFNSLRREDANKEKICKLQENIISLKKKINILTLKTK